MVGGIIQPLIFNLAAHLILFDMVFIMCNTHIIKKFIINLIESIKDLKQQQKKCPNEQTIIFYGHFEHKSDHF